MTHKICSKCNNSLLLEQFSWKQKANQIRQPACKACTKIQAGKCYQKNKEKVYRDSKIRTQHYAKRFQEWKATVSCVVCDLSEACCLEFHHINDDGKDGRVSTALSRLGKDGIIKEMKKCVLVCANCHHRIHFGSIVLQPIHLSKMNDTIQSFEDFDITYSKF
jgi:hypothetical protein